MDMATYSVPEIERITRVAAQCALAADPPLAVHSIDKANVLATSRLWRKTVTALMEKEYPQLELDHHLVDSAAMIMVANPRKLNGVVVTENLFGDMCVPRWLVCVIWADIFLLVFPTRVRSFPVLWVSCRRLPWPALRTQRPSSWVSTSRKSRPFLTGSLKLISPSPDRIHGSAPDIAGKGYANPIGTILSAAMMLRYSLGKADEAELIERAVSKVLDSADIGGFDYRTRDLGGKRDTKEVGDKILEVLEGMLSK